MADRDNYSPFLPGQNWGQSHGTAPYQVAALERIATCLCAQGGATVLPTVSTPVFSPISGSYEIPFLITLTCDTPDAEIHYTIDGSMPDATSPLYDPDIGLHILSDTTIQAIGIALGYNNSEVASATYTIDFPQAAAPIFDPAPGDYPVTQLVTLTSPNGGEIRYTLDGSGPTGSSTLYTGPIVVSSDETIRAIAIVDGFDDSPISNGAYTITALVVATPTFSPNGGNFSGTVDVTISTTTLSATLYYTTDGSTPDTSSFLYTGPVTLDASTILKAIAIRSGYTDSGIRTATFTLVVTTVTNIIFGGNFNPNITDFNEWAGGGGNIAFTQTTDIPVPIVSLDVNLTEFSLVSGQYAYIAMRNDTPAPAASGGFKNGSFNLNPFDFAGAADGFTDIDDNGWPCFIGTLVSDGNEYREYRLLNAPFAAITVTINQ